jgi:tRNA threonylcarbamoyl adenosine modification protein YeaZ
MFMSKSYILAVETVTKAGSVSLFSDQMEEVYFSVGSSSGKLSNDIIGMISSLMKKSNVNLSEITKIAVSDGPGSFTGLRVGWATVKGMAKGLNIPFVSVPILSALLKSRKSHLLPDCAFISIGGGKIALTYANSTEISVKTLSEFLSEAEKLPELNFITISDTLNIFPVNAVPENIFYPADNVSSLIGLAADDGRSEYNVNYIG